jgi:hypothetical protein
MCESCRDPCAHSQSASLDELRANSQEALDSVAIRDDALPHF